MSQKFVKATIVRKNGIQLPTPLNREINCEGVKSMAVEWLVPEKAGGVLLGYDNRIYATAPTTDSIKTLRLIDENNNDVFILLASGQDENSFVTFCNACCGTGNDFTNPLSDIPGVILEETVCIDDDGNYIYFATVPQNPFSKKIILSNFSANGVAGLGFTQTVGGYASLAALVTALNSSASSFGTWSSSGGRLKLLSTTTTSVNLDIDVVASAYCLALPASPFTATKLVVKDNTDTDQEIVLAAPLITSRANSTAIAAALAAYLKDATPVAHSGGTGGAGTASVSGGAVTGVAVGAGGSGYVTAPTITFTGGGGTGAVAHAVLTSGAISSFVVDTPGTGYSTPPTVVITPAGTDYVQYTGLMKPVKLTDGTNNALFTAGTC